MPGEARQRRGAPSVGWWGAAAVATLLVGAYVGGPASDGSLTWLAVYFAATMATGMAVGLWVWARRPRTHMGPLMFWWPALWLAGDIATAFPESRVASTIGVALFVMGPIAFAQMALSYPTGTFVRSRLAWVFVFVLGYAAQVVQNVYNLLFLDLSACPPCPPPRVPTLFHVDAVPPISLEDWNDGWLVFVIAILPIGLFVLYRAYIAASPAHRRALAPVVVTASFITCTSWVTSYAVLTDRFGVLTPVSWLQTTGALVASLTALLGVAVTWWARGSVGDLVVQLERVGPGAARDTLARTLGDPTLELALWLPDRRIWSDEAGREIALPTGRDRAVTMVGDRLAAIVHDPALLAQPELLEAAGSAARLALENERLQAELRGQLEELRTSRARIIRAVDDERRRIERDLHDVAQQRLLGVGVTLGLLRSRVEGDVTAVEVLDGAADEVKDVLKELRELARGVHPAVLTDEGLDAAVRTLAQRMPVPVTVRATAERLPAHIESAAYFVVAEALANITKHAHASSASVSIVQHEGVLTVEIRDDGIGGASVNGSSGLRGLGDRVGALDGSLQVDSDAGQGTRLLVEIPCAS
jgi:signal transduction histidine kinase